MKDSHDKLTFELVDPPKRGRGRPSTGAAMSSADRQKARRDRIRAAGGAFLTVPIDGDLNEALKKYLFGKDMTIESAVDRILRDRLLRKR